ncbi:MAG TPA: hypothetical protein VFK15_07020 [Burkholderiales bacterium]|jgi:hypothetical protein|nr:hypothetical protein [Burkholderiales bacterium]
MMPRAALAVLALVALAGCVTPPAEIQPPPGTSQPPAEAPTPEAQPEVRYEPEIVYPRVPPAPVRRADDVERLLAYFEQVRKLPAAELQRENDSARAAFNRTRTDFDRMRLALILSVPNTALTDDQRAYELLDPVVKNPASSLSGLALLMSTYLQERRRLENGMQHLQQNVQGLQQKLDALMSLERTLIDREQSTTPRKK